MGEFCAIVQGPSINVFGLPRFLHFEIADRSCPAEICRGIFAVTAPRASTAKRNLRCLGQNWWRNLERVSGHTSVALTDSVIDRSNGGRTRKSKILGAKPTKASMYGVQSNRFSRSEALCCAKSFLTENYILISSSQAPP